MARDRLEMQMVGSRSAAVRTVVEHRVPVILLRKRKHVREMMPDGLRDMLFPGDHEMPREDRIRIDLDIVAAALAAFELHVELLLGTVLRAEEAGTCRYGLGIGDSGRGRHTLGIMLHLAGQSPDGEVLGPGGLEGTEIR